MAMAAPDHPHDHVVLDPCLLGRPVHLLPRFGAGLAASLDAAMAAPGARRHWGTYRLQDLAFARGPLEDTLRWLGIKGVFGTASIAFERSLLLGLLEGRYLRRTMPPGAAPPPDPAAERITATEERLAATLAAQLAALLDERIADGLAATGVALPPQGAYPAPASAPGAACWTIHAVLRHPYGRRESDAPALAPPAARFWIGLDQRLMGHVLQSLTGQRGVRAVHTAREPLGARLTLRLDGRLVSRDITLATLFDLRVGDVIPVAMGRADVLLDDARLFTAAVAEHQGKLCLTAFEDAESWT